MKNPIAGLPWQRLLAESVAIVVSILLAFWIDAWWDDRRDQTEQRTLLAALRVELLSFDRTLAANDQFVAGIRQSAATLLDATTQSRVDLTDDEVNRLISDLTWYVEPTTLDLPVLESIVTSGEIANLSSSSLRNHLSSWLVKINAVRSSIGHDFYLYVDRQMPFLEQHASLISIYAVPSHRPGFPEVSYPSVYAMPSEPVSPQALLRNQVFQNILINRISTLTGVVEWRDSDIKAQLSDIVALIDSELGTARRAVE